MGDLLVGDLGGVTSYSETVGEGVARTIPLSMQLLLYSQLIAILVAVPGALIGALLYRGRSSDIAARAVGLMGLSTPVYVIGPILVFLFAVGEFGVSGSTSAYESCRPGATCRSDPDSATTSSRWPCRRSPWGSAPPPRSISCCFARS